MPAHANTSHPTHSSPSEGGAALPDLPSPARLLAIVLISVATAEAIIMVVLLKVRPLSPLLEVCVDAVALGAVLFPLLSVYVFRPMQALVHRYRTALDEVKTLRGIIPICSNCKHIRDDKGAWQQVEVYVRAHSEAEFSHGLCPNCIRELYGDDAEAILKKIQAEEAEQR